ncbi:hypothetical protein [Bradyrhizobium sp. Cp5.3]|uniref:hypothetical protein n=1 Tax=Bradyrhizobium sp. Cp5.3 TaxID=443598 RepID=UPI0012EC501A|nr:hypothetical protein [Bradyrhizobium sp. Cp5.3]
MTRPEPAFQDTSIRLRLAVFANLKKPIALSLDEVVQRIIKLNDGLQKFWSKSHGWAPVEAAGLLSKSRLDWQVSLSETLYLSVKKPSHTLTGDVPGSVEFLKRSALPTLSR